MYSTHEPGPKLAKLLYLRNFDSKVYEPGLDINISIGPRQGICKETCRKENKNHWLMSLAVYPMTIEFETPITNSNILVDICKTSENGFTQYSVF